MASAAATVRSRALHTLVAFFLLRSRWQRALAFCIRFADSPYLQALPSGGQQTVRRSSRNLLAILRLCRFPFPVLTTPLPVTVFARAFLSTAIVTQVPPKRAGSGARPVTNGSDAVNQTIANCACVIRRALHGEQI